MLGLFAQIAWTALQHINEPMKINNQAMKWDTAGMRRVHAVNAILERTVLYNADRFFSIPSYEISKCLPAAGWEIDGLLRQASNLPGYEVPTTSHFGDPDLVFDLVGAGVVAGKDPVPWVATVTNIPEFESGNGVVLAARLIALGQRSIWPRTANLCCRSRRSKNAQAVFALLDRLIQRWRMNGQSPQRNEPLPSILPPNPQIVIFCLESAGQIVAKEFPGKSIVPLEGVALPDSLAVFCAGLQAELGEGWLYSIAAFRSALERVLKMKVPKSVTVPEYHEQDEMLLRPQIAASKFLEFGWALPSKRVHGSDEGNQVGKVKSDDIQLWSGSSEDFDAIESPFLALLDAQALRLTCMQTFESRFAEDSVIIAFDRRRHHGADEEGPPAWTCLPPLSSTAFSVLRLLLPELPWKVVGFSPGCSRTTHSAILERVFRIGNKVGAGWRTHPARKWLEVQIDPLLQNRSLKLPSAKSQLDICDNLELCERFKAEEVFCETLAIQPRRLRHEKEKYSVEEKNPFDPLDEQINPFFGLFRMGRHDFEDRRNGLELLTEMTASYWNVPGSMIRTAIEKMRSSGDWLFHKMLQTLVRRVLARTTSIKTKARYPEPAKHKDMFVSIIRTLLGFLGIEKRLREWLASSWRFVVILPVDRLCANWAPVPDICVQEPVKRVGCGELHSSRYYVNLFCSNSAPGTAPLNIEALLKAASCALKPGTQEGPGGWLAGKISETNELSAYLRQRIQYDPSFPLDDLPKRLGEPDILQRLLVNLNSPLLVRCIKSTASGGQILSNWQEGLQRNCKAALAGAGSENPVDYGTSQDWPTTLLRDVEGLACAALDFSRAEFQKSGTFYKTIYFGPLHVRHYFTDQSSAFNARKDPGYSPFSGTATDHDCVLEYFMRKRIPPESIALYASQWEREIGRGNDKTAGHYLDDMNRYVQEMISSTERRKIDQEGEGRVEALRKFQASLSQAQQILQKNSDSGDYPNEPTNP